MSETFNDPWVTGRIDALKAINAALHARVTHLEALLREPDRVAAEALVVEAALRLRAARKALAEAMTRAVLPAEWGALQERESRAEAAYQAALDGVEASRA